MLLDEAEIRRREERLRRSWSISKGGLAEALVWVVAPLVAFFVAVAWPPGSVLAAVALAVALALPAFAVARGRSTRPLLAVIQGIKATAVNLCAVYGAYVLLAMPNFFFA